MPMEIILFSEDRRPKTQARGSKPEIQNPEFITQGTSIKPDVGVSEVAPSSLDASALC